MIDSEIDCCNLEEIIILIPIRKIGYGAADPEIRYNSASVRQTNRTSSSGGEALTHNTKQTLHYLWGAVYRGSEKTRELIKYQNIDFKLDKRV